MIAPRADRVKAPNPETKPARPVHVILLSYVCASLVKPLQYDSFNNVTPFSGVLKLLYELLSIKRFWLTFRSQLLMFVMLVFVFQ